MIGWNKLCNPAYMIMHYLYAYMNISTAPLTRQNTELLQWILPMKLKDQMSQIHCPQLRLATCFFLFCFISPPPSFTHKLHQSVFVPHNELLWLARPILTPYIFNLFQKNDTLQRPCKCVVLVMSVDKTVDVLSLMAKSINLARSCVYPCPPGHPHPMRIRRPLQEAWR